MIDDTDLSSTDLITWVQDKVDEWAEHYTANYQEKHDEYDRIWRGIWAASDKTRQSERSRIVAPASAQAVESSVAEVEEAIFGRGDFIDIRDDKGDNQPEDVVHLRQELLSDFKKRKFRRAFSEVLITSAVTGTGICEMVIDEITEVAPATQPIDANTQAVGVEEVDRVVVEYRPIHPKNFRIDPAATSVEGSIGVAIDEFVPVHQVEALQEKGVYREGVPVGVAAWDTKINPDQSLVQQPRTQCRLIKYYGLVPTELLRSDEDDPAEDPLAEFDIERPEREATEYTEAIVVIDVTSGELLKAEENPFMMRTRPVVAFSWDIMPGRFWGRGVVEKGYNSQKAIDAELRARADALALTAHPMLAVDGTRLPRGINAKVVPGKTLITSGNPNEILRPFNFGSVDQITFAQVNELQKMLQQATGAVDTAGLPNDISNARSGAVSMSLSGIIKRHKRTLINIQEDFLIPLVEQTAWMYMQFDPDRFPVKDYKFSVSASLGIMAREHETQQLVTLLQTTGQDNPAYVVLLQSIIDNMQLSNREELSQFIAQASQPSPEEQQAAQRQAQLQEQLLQSQTAAYNATANESNKRAEKLEYEKRGIPIELENDRIEAISRNLQAGNEDDKEFERRFKTANLMLQERKIDLETFDKLTGGSGLTGVTNPAGGNNGTNSQAGRLTAGGRSS